MRAMSWIVLALTLTAGPALAQVNTNGQPPPGYGSGPSARLSGADGVIFEDVEGGVRHGSSAFICPDELEGFRRTRLLIFDRTDGGRDVGCNFVRGESWFTLYLTRLPGRSGEDVFETYELQAQNAAPPQGEATPPLAAGLPPLPAFASFWKNDKGGIDGLWMSQIGDWHIKLRTTYLPEDEAAVMAFAEALYRRIHEQVDAPEI